MKITLDLLFGAFWSSVGSVLILIDHLSNHPGGNYNNYAVTADLSLFWFEDLKRYVIHVIFFDKKNITYFENMNCYRVQVTCDQDDRKGLRVF